MSRFVELAGQVTERARDVERLILEGIDRDRFRWFVVRDYVDALWAWIRNTP